MCVVGHNEDYEANLTVLADRSKTDASRQSKQKLIEAKQMS